MKTIYHKLILLTSFLIMVSLLSLLLLINNFIIFGIDIWGLFALLLPALGLLIILLMRELEVYRIAKLIIENKILNIEAAEILKKSDDSKKNVLKIGGLEVFISCFGILLGSRVIKFNLDGVSLKKVEIAKDIICLVYGTDKDIHSIKLVHGTLAINDLQSIVERFRYETGITPTIID